MYARRTRKSPRNVKGRRDLALKRRVGQPEKNMLAYEGSLASYGDVGARARLEAKGWIVDGDFSGEREVVFRKGDRTVVAFRGTTDLEDVGVDLGLAVGVYGKEFERAQKVVEAVKSSGGTLVTGHSLGGSKAIYAGDGHDVVTFNAGTGVFGTRVRSGVHFVGTSDPISARLRGEGIIEVPYAGHRLTNFESEL